LEYQKINLGIYNMPAEPDYYSIRDAHIRKMEEEAEKQRQALIAAQANSNQPLSGEHMKSPLQRLLGRGKKRTKRTNRKRKTKSRL